MSKRYDALNKKAKRVEITQVRGGFREKREDLVVSELPLVLLVNGKRLVTIYCSPDNLEALALGCLTSSELIRDRDDVISMKLKKDESVLDVRIKEEKEWGGKFLQLKALASGGGKEELRSLLPAQKIDTRVYISEDKIFTLMEKFKRRSQLFRDTGGVHSAALCKQKEIILFTEDIGRHNALDKIIGESLQEGIPLEDKIILSSGRITSEIVTKLAKQRIPILISKAAPTDLGIQIAEEIGMTLVGFVRGKRMNIYSYDWRIKNK